MKIAFIGGRNIHELGGIENYMYNLATRLVTSGHEPIVFCESDHYGTERVNGFIVIHQKAIGGRFLCKILLAYRASIMTLIRREGISLYHYNAWPPSLASWIPRLFGKQVLLQGHGLEWKRTKYNSGQQKIMRTMELLTAKMHRNITVVSHEQTEYFAKHYNRLCRTIPTAVNLPSGELQSDILERFRLQKEAYFLYMGRLVQDKNPDYLIKAYLQSGLDDIKLVIAGSNDSNPHYVEMLHKLASNSPSIVFTGAVYGDDKEILLKNCHTFCIPSSLEGLPITLLEAMSYGRICIATNIPSNHEALGRSGIWCKVEDISDLAVGLREAVLNGSKYAWQKEYNRSRIAENFTWEKVTKKYVEYIQSLCKE